MNEDIPKNKAIDIKEAAEMHKWGGTVFMPRPTTTAAAKPENEVKKFQSLLSDAWTSAYGKRERDTTNTKPVEKPTDLEQSKKEFDKLYKENEGKIKGDFPKNIFNI